MTQRIFANEISKDQGTYLRVFLGGKESLRHKTLVGSQWLFLKSCILGAVDLLKTAIFARILFPADYGVMALAMIAIGMLQSFTSIGIELMVLRENHKIEEDLPTYWSIRCLFGILLALLSWFVAVPLAAYYQEPKLIGLIRFLGLIFLFNGLAGFGVEITQRRMEFNKVAIVECLAALGVLAAGVGVLFAFRNVWALAIYTVATAFSKLIISYILYPWVPRFTFNNTMVKAVAVFSSSMVTINILNYLFNNFDRAVVGKLLGIELLGFYARAHFLAIIPAIYIFNIISPAVFQAFRNLAHDLLRFRRAFLKVVGVFALISISIGFLSFVFSRHIILIVYGERWLPLQPIFKILLILSVTKSIIAACSPVFVIRGKPWLATFTTAVMVFCFGILCIPMTIAYQVSGTAAAVVISALISHGLSIYFAYRLLTPAGC